MKKIHRNVRLGMALLAAGLVCVAPIQAQMASFDMTSNVLTLDMVSVNSQSFYSNVALAVPPAQAWSILPGARQISPLSASNVANYANGQLTLPRTVVGNLTYDGFILNLPIGAPMTIATMGAVSSASFPGYETVAFPIRSKIKNGAETDSGGELTYALTNGQVWKHFIDEPCMPPGIGTEDPDGYSDVEIYPNVGSSGSTAANEGNYRFVTYYPSKAEAQKVETCIVTAVSGVFGVPQAPSPNSLAVSPAEINGTAGSTHNLFIAGGAPPYLVVTSAPGIADFSFQNEAELKIKLSKVGSTTLTVFDNNRLSVTSEVTVALDAVGPFFSPNGVDGFSVGAQVDVAVLFGNAPFTIHNPLPQHIQFYPVGNANTTRLFRMKILSLPPSSGSVDTIVKVIDAGGSSADFPIKGITDPTVNNLALGVTPTALVLTPATTQAIFGIVGGYPPYTVHNPNPNVLDINMLSSNTFSVKVRVGASTWQLSGDIQIPYSDSRGYFGLSAIVGFDGFTTGFTGYE